MWMHVVGVGVAAACAAVGVGCASGGTPAPSPLEIEYDASLGIDLDTMERRSSGLLVHDDVEGSGAEATPGREVVVHFIGSFPDGTVFDSSVAEGGEPLRFRLGEDPVIRAWNEGLRGMREGGLRTLIAPPRLAYGRQGVSGVIPANQVLVFKIQLLEVR